jgi:hypothetical protein
MTDKSTDKPQEKPSDSKIPAKKAARARDEESELPPDSDLEDRFNHFWKTHGNTIFAAAAIAMVVVLGVQVYDYMKARAVAAKQADFVAAMENDDLEAFASEYSGQTLGGIATLKVAHKFYEEENFIEARNRYEAAAKTLSGTPFFERARLGAAMSRLLGGDAQGGSMDLGSIASNAAFTDPTRAEAAYNLALHYWEQEDYTAMETAIEQILTLSSPGMNGARAERLRERIPQAAQG